MDILDDILDTLAMKGVLYFRTDFSSPWAVTVPELGQAARFHLVVQGRCHVEVAGSTVDLGPGDLVLIPRGRGHVLADAPGRPAPPLESVLADAGYNGQGVFAVGAGDPAAATQMLCGHFGFRDGADHPLLRALPDHILLTAGMRAAEPWLDETLRLAARRAMSDSIGSTAAVTRLSEIVFIEMLRAGIGHSPAMRALLDGFGDRHVGRALQLIHEAPQRAWTVDSLASAVGMSRSRFAARFRALVGVAPMAYLTDWRLQKALALLDDGRRSVQQVAVHAGYRSPAAFTRAFAGRFGIPPTAYRRARPPD